VIRVRRDARAAVHRLLGRTAIAPDLQTALRLHRTDRHGHRFVTFAGDVVEADGRVTSASSRSGTGAAGWLSRRLEIGELREQVAMLDTAIEAANEQIARILSDSEQAQQRREETERQLHAARHEQVEAQYQMQRLANDGERLDRERQGLASEQSELGNRLASLRQERQQLEQRHAETGQQLDLATTEAAEAEESSRAVQAKAEAAQERLTEARVNVGQLTEQLQAARRERRHVELSLEEASRQHEVSMAQLHRRLSQIEQYEATIADAVEEGARAAGEAAAVEQQCGELEALVRTAGETVTQAARRLDEARERAGGIDREYQEAEISRREVQVKLESLEERTLSELELDLAEAYAGHLEHRGTEDFAPLDRDSARVEIETLRTEIKQLGPVNLEAIDEEHVLSRSRTSTRRTGSSRRSSPSWTRRAARASWTRSARSASTSPDPTGCSGGSSAAAAPT
jgi:chromosome segregation protein